MPAVWSPIAKEVMLLVDGQSVAMQKDENDWWFADYPLAHGQDYQFKVDGVTVPDPRSPWQPDGVHGASRHVDHSQFAWNDEMWQAPPLSSAVLYELHIGTFTQEGTFEAAISRLEHLKSLGVTHVELMPVAEFLGNHGWGYDGVYPYAPHHAYGGPDGLKRLVQACHSVGLAVVLDVVYNHLGPSGNYLPRFGPYFSDRHTTPWGTAINFDGPHSDEVRRFFCDNALSWLRDYHFDGLRLDAVHAIVDTSAYPFLEQLATEVDELAAHLGRHLVLIAESDLNDPRVVRSREVGGYGLDAQWSDDIHHALHSVLTGERDGYYSDFGPLADLAMAMSQPYVYAGRHSTFRKRTHGRQPTNLNGHRFLAYIQNHDQLGNRARGDRLIHLVNHERAKIAAALVLMSPYVPMLFQGEEWAASAPFQYFVDFGSEPDLAKAVAEGRAKEFASFGWDPSDVPNPTSPQTFWNSKVSWDELSQAEHAEMLAWHRQLIGLRRKHPVLTNGRLDHIVTDFNESEQWLRVERGPLTILCNFAREQRQIACRRERCGRLLLSSQACSSSADEAIEMPPESVAIFESVNDA